MTTNTPNFILLLGDASPEKRLTKTITDMIWTRTQNALDDQTRASVRAAVSRNLMARSIRESRDPTAALEAEISALRNLV